MVGSGWMERIRNKNRNKRRVGAYAGSEVQNHAKHQPECAGVYTTSSTPPSGRRRPGLKLGAKQRSFLWKETVRSTSHPSGELVYILPRVLQLRTYSKASLGSL